MQKESNKKTAWFYHLSHDNRIVKLQYHEPSLQLYDVFNTDQARIDPMARVPWVTEALERIVRASAKP